MPDTPSPSPEISDKRILIAFLLCFTGCGHRIYADKTISGLVQMALLLGSSLRSFYSSESARRAVFCATLCRSGRRDHAAWVRLSLFAKYFSRILRNSPTTRGS